jgi:3-hydroxybutyryl-CoA dehydrogenase
VESDAVRVVVAGELPLVEEIAQLCLGAGHDTAVYLVEDFLSAVESGYLMEDIDNVEVVVELHNESADAKQELLLGLGNAVPEEALLLTSALPVSTTHAAAWVPNPERVAGFGLVPPLREGGMVELAAGLRTGPACLLQAADFWHTLGFEPVVVADGPGLVRARIICCLINEAVSALMEDVASVADIDRAMKLGTHYPLGPLEWADLIGLDTVLGVMTGLFAEWGEDRYRPAPLLRRMVLAGRLGRKSGEGFYRYGEGQ